MRWILFLRWCSFSLVLLAASTAQAAGRVAEPAHVSSGFDKNFALQLNWLVRKPLDAALFTFSNALGVRSSISNISFEGALPGLFSNSVEHSAIVLSTLSVAGILPCVQIISCFAATPKEEGFVQSARYLDLMESAEYGVNQSAVVPLPAAMWLFSCALFGFVMVANRRKA